MATIKFIDLLPEGFKSANNYDMADYSRIKEGDTITIPDLYSWQHHLHTIMRILRAQAVEMGLMLVCTKENDWHWLGIVEQHHFKFQGTSKQVGEPFNGIEDLPRHQGKYYGKDSIPKDLNNVVIAEAVSIDFYPKGTK